MSAIRPLPFIVFEDRFRELMPDTSAVINRIELA
jgi:hypothetical protein